MDPWSTTAVNNNLASHAIWLFLFWNPVWTSLEHFISSLEFVGMKLNEPLNEPYPYTPESLVLKSQKLKSAVANFVVSQLTPWISVDLLSDEWILLKSSRIHLTLSIINTIRADHFQPPNILWSWESPLRLRMMLEMKCSNLCTWAEKMSRELIIYWSE